MDDTLQLKAKMMMDAHAHLKKNYRWVNEMSLRFAACIYALTGRSLDIAEFDEMIMYIKGSAGCLSYFRSSLMHPIAAQLINNFDDPRQAFEQVLMYDKALKANGFITSSQRGIAAYALLLTCPQEELGSRIPRVKELYKRMRKAHPWLTSANSYGIAVLMAAEKASLDELIERMEEIYQLLRQQGFKQSQGLQFLSHLMTFSTEPGYELSQRCRRVLDFFKYHRLKVSSMYYSAIGLIALQGSSLDRALADVVKMADYLKNNKALKWHNKEMTIMLICALVSNEYMEGHKQNLGITSIGIAIEALIAAQAAAMISVIAASSAVTAANTSSR